MLTRASRGIAAVVVAAFLSVAIAGVVSADATSDTEILKLFEDGVQYYQTGEFEKAREAFDELLLKKPGLHVALEMRNRVELAVFFKMKSEKEVGDQADKVLRLMMRAVRESRRTEGKPEELVKDFTSGTVEAYGIARAALKGYGPYAVPCLVPLLKAQEAGKQHIAGRALSLLGVLQRDACLPVTVALREVDDPLIRVRLAGVLQQLDDWRAVAALKALWEDKEAPQTVHDAAAEALESIVGKPVEEIPSAVESYIELAKAYLFEETGRVGYTYGMSADVWRWDPAGASLDKEITYETVPAYLYCQKMAAQTAAHGLELDPANQELQAILASGLVRQMALCEHFKSAKRLFGGIELSDEQHQDAARRAEELSISVPVTLRLMDSAVVSRALELTLKADDAPASLYLVRLLGQRRGANPRVLGPATMQALDKALRSGDKNVRYEAAVLIVRACPGGACCSPADVINVMSAALGVATRRNALVLIDDFQLRNTLGDVLRQIGISPVETRVDEGPIEACLSIEPSIDVIFLSAGVPDVLFKSILSLLEKDVRTKGLPVYVVVGPEGAEARIAEYEGYEAILNAHDIRIQKLEPILQEKVLSKSQSPFTEEEETLVLKALAAVNEVDPQATNYDLGKLQSPLIQALYGYSDEVTIGVIRALGTFGAPEVLEPLRAIAASERAKPLRIASCNAMASIMTGAAAPASDKVLQTLDSLLQGDDQDLRIAAAEALSAAGLEAAELMERISP
ncbi:MAG: HEAT repeat domain-containing protein [Planctomycetes bacterium]|nr:HEAT repeat domain-containing protein [Planctomycetota bacterium]